MRRHRRTKKNLKNLFGVAVQIQKYAGNRGYFIPGIFLIWYIFALLFYPELVLWWLATTLSFMLVSITFIWPKSVLYWLVPCIFLFNNIKIFALPWPYIKMSYIGALSVCFSAVFGIYNNQDNERKHDVFSFDFQFFFACLCFATLLGVASNFMPDQLASITELKMQLRVIPFIDQNAHFISLRFLWLWSCGISLYWALTKLIKNANDIKRMMWSIQWISLPVSIFGIYSYMTKTYMANFYVYERRINSTFSSPAVLADIFTAVLIFGVYLFVKSKSWWRKSILAVLMAFQFTAIILSGCRANIIIILIFAIAWFSIYIIKKIRRHQLKLILILGITVPILMITVFKLSNNSLIKKIPTIERFFFWKDSVVGNRNVLDTLFEGRKWHWQCGLKMVGSYPVWGIGSGLFEQEYSDFKIRSDLFNVARAHDVPLRILAECGIITFITFFIFLLLTAIRLACGFSQKTKELAFEESSYIQMLSVGLLALFLLSLFSDIIILREECVFFIAIIAACSSSAFSKLPHFESNKFLSTRSKLKKIERKMQRTFQSAGWTYFINTRLSSVLKLLAFVILFILFIIGLSSAKARRLSKLKSGKLSYGFYNKTPGVSSSRLWCSMGAHAIKELEIKRENFYFGYRAVNNRMAVLGGNLSFYVNGVLIENLPLNSIKERWVCCDMEMVTNQFVRIEFKTDKVFVPLKEHWFADNYSYGAVITKPMLTNKIKDKIKGKRIIKISVKP